MPAWQAKATAKRQAREALIPDAWRLPPSLLLDLPLDVHSVPHSHGPLTEAELAITEEDDARELVSRLARREVSAVAVCTAFCKRAAIAHQLVRPGPARTALSAAAADPH